MGAGPSTSAVSPELANKLLTAIFTQTDIGAYLSMTDPKACANFDFSSVNPASQQQLQAAGGQLRVVGQGQNAEKLTICFDEAKGYSKGFEIFAALYPLLADSAVKRAGVSLLGGRRQTRRVQRGGAEISSTASPGFIKIRDTAIYPLWFVKGFSIDYDPRSDILKTVLNLTPEGRKGISFDIPLQSLTQSQISVQGLVYNRPAIIPPCTVAITKTSGGSGGDDEYVFSINGVAIMEFTRATDGWYLTQIVDARENSSLHDIPLKGSRKDVVPIASALIKKIKDVVGIIETGGQGQATSSYAAAGGQSYGGQLQPQAYGGQPQAPLALAGSFFPQGPANVKRGLSNMKAKKVNPPLALAIARALILLKQIDPANIRGPPTTQICSRNYTFEGKDANVPRKGIPLEKTFYFKSWMNLFNDIGEYRQGKYEWTQSSGGRAKLEEAAKDLSVLYSSQVADPKFLSKPLPEFIKACPNRFEGEYLIPPQVLPQIQAIVQKLLQVQTTYAGRANAILAKVFVFKADGTVSFRPEILGRRGYQNLSTLCVETRETLFDYYMRVESLFIEGLIIYEQAVALGVLKPV
jgi:hypothetical protein